MFYNNLSKALLIAFLMLGVSGVFAGTLQVVSITEDFASLARSVGGDRVQVQSLILGSRNLHHVNPKPSMVLKVRRADVLLRLGMDQDSWIDGLIQTARNSRVFPGKTGYIDCSSRIDALEVPTGKIDGRMGDMHIEGNPHYWLDPNNAKIIARQLYEVFAELDPESNAYFKTRLTAFIAELDRNMLRWQADMSALKITQFVSYHKVWSYFYNAFGLTRVGELESLPGIPPSTKHLSALMQRVKQQDRPVKVITAMYYPSNVGQHFAQQVGGQSYVLSANVGEKGITSYSELIDHLVGELTK